MSGTEGLIRNPAGDSIEQEHSTVPFSYRARLSWTEKVPSRPKPEKRSFGDPEWYPTVNQEHSMALAGRLHPKVYSVQEATALFQEKILPLLDLGWRLIAVHVKAYDEADA